MLTKVRITGIHPDSSWCDTQRARFIGKHALVGIAYHMDAAKNIKPNGPFASGEVFFVDKRLALCNCIHGFTYKRVKKGRSSSCLERRMPPL